MRFGSRQNLKECSGSDPIEDVKMVQGVRALLPPTVSTNREAVSGLTFLMTAQICGEGLAAVQ